MPWRTLLSKAASKEHGTLRHQPSKLEPLFMKEEPPISDLQERRVIKYSFNSVNDVQQSLTNLQSYTERS